MRKSNRFPDSSLIREIWARAAFYGLHTMTSLAAALDIPYDRFVDRMHHPEKFTVQELTIMHREIGISLDAINQEVRKGHMKNGL